MGGSWWPPLGQSESWSWRPCARAAELSSVSIHHPEKAGGMKAVIHTRVTNCDAFPLKVSAEDLEI